MLRFWNRLLNVENTGLTREIFLLEYVSRGSWCKYIECTLKGIQMEDSYTNKVILDLVECQTELIINFEVNWKKTVN